MEDCQSKEKWGGMVHGLPALRFILRSFSVGGSFSGGGLVENCFASFVCFLVLNLFLLLRDLRKSA